MVAVLMSTYNGNKYLPSQIESIIKQTYEDWILFIRDDGSSDDTVNIIKNYVSADRRIRFLNDKILHRGCAGSFLYMLDKIEADYYMFADQDDIWMPDKIESCVELCKKNQIYNEPIVIHSDLVVVDRELNTIASSFWDYAGLTAIIGKPKYLPVCNYVTGCTMFFNKQARDICKYNYSKAMMHDSWITLNVVLNKGIILQIDRPLILYRQHNENVLGAQKPEPLVLKWKKINQVIKSNYQQYQMVNAIKKYSLPKYLVYKCLFFIKKIRKKNC